MLNSLVWACVAWAAADTPPKFEITETSTIKVEGGATSICMSNGGGFSFATINGDTLSIYSQDQKILMSFRDAETRLVSLAIADDDKTVAVAGETDSKEGIIVIYDTKTRKEAHRTSFGKATSVTDLSLNPRTLVIAAIISRTKGPDRRSHLSLIDCQSGKWIPTPEFIKDPHTITTACFDAKGTYLAVGTKSGQVRIYNYEKKTLIWETQLFERSVETIRVSADDKYLAGISDRSVKLLNLKDGTEKCTFSYEGLILSSTFSSDGNYFLYGGMHALKQPGMARVEIEGRLKVCRLSTGEEVISKRVFQNSLFGISSSGNSIITCGFDGEDKGAIRSWRIALGK